MSEIQFQPLSFEKALQECDKFFASHRIDPYTPAEIAELTNSTKMLVGYGKKEAA